VTQEETPAVAGAGDNVNIHPTVLIFGAEHVTVGSNVRIDAHCIITAGPGKVEIGDHVHLGAAVHIFGSAGVRISDFCGLSSRVSIFSTSDDYSEGHLTNPTVPEDLRKVTAAPVALERHAIIGCGSVLMPGITVGEGAAVGALSMVNRSVPAYSIVSGNPMRRIGERDGERLAEMEKRIPR
jgi:galactoside O-acetyltransferase